MLTPEQKDDIINARGEKDTEDICFENKKEPLTPKIRCFTILFKNGETATFLSSNGMTFEEAWAFNGSKFGLERIKDIVKIS